ncbi:guanylate kinase [Malacoplasma penetrans]|uniref:Guanylate kinase n=1 Tax=Malacoplasma penetrans (strain HF-2) TaxID=272633 RepID=KGUA_MALP2|nr:guanylate kinase [Malacoplasma penetrans]Q8EVJ9.1 RecName: Full=Guanylate kinase; AltName: Full=GMP kinase [Malacoplasma penetrans HF-2]RXY96404.1 guanylate kinase [Malacoplasma penetrans]BAC44354.1 guanylate kinase [Malacoplasma penetrans HF-2]
MEEKNKKGKIIIISGPSGVGKKTIIDQVINNVDLNLTYSISMTTRLPREHEKNGVDYFFVSEEEFNSAIEKGELLEWAEFANNKYGTPIKNLYKLIGENKNVILEIEVQGATKVKDILNREDYISIFLIPPSIRELKRRLKIRDTETKEKIKQRIKRAKVELKLQNEYDFIILNDDAKNAADKLRHILYEKVLEKK